MTEQSYEIREFGGSAPDSRIASDLASLHETLLPHSPLVLMGPDFMRSFYYGLLPADDFICGAVAYCDDAPAGFIVATGDANGFMSKATRRHWLRLGWIVFSSVVRKPTRLKGMKEAYDIQSNVQAQEYGPEIGELLSFGVLPDYRSRKFVKNSGLHLSSDLLDTAVRQLEERGKSRLRAIVDKDNIEAQFFYRSKGWEVGLKSVKGWSVPTMEFVKALTPEECHNQTRS